MRLERWLSSRRGTVAHLVDDQAFVICGYAVIHRDGCQASDRVPLCKRCEKKLAERAAGSSGGEQ